MSPMRILIVDDEQELVQALTERLLLRGFHAHGVHTGSAALHELDTSSYDVVLLDVKMPGLGGLEVIKQIKAKHPGLQVVMLTGHGSAPDAEMGLKLGAFDYLMKPVDIKKLIEVLNAAYAAGKAQQA